MADEVERIMVIPLRATKQAPRTRRAKRAVKEVREIVMRHMKVDAEHVWIDASVNEKLWENGIRNPNPQPSLQDHRESGQVRRRSRRGLAG